MATIEDIIREHEEIVRGAVDDARSGNLTFEDDAELSGQALEFYNSGQKSIDAPAKADDLLRRYLWVRYSTCLNYDLGYTKMFPPKTKCCPLRCRDWYVYAVARICHPAAGEVWDDIVDCLRAALAAAGLAAIISGAPGAIATFKSVFWACMIDKGYTWANEISISISTDTRNGEWRRC